MEISKLLCIKHPRLFVKQNGGIVLLDLPVSIGQGNDRVPIAGIRAVCVQQSGQGSIVIAILEITDSCFVWVSLSLLF